MKRYDTVYMAINKSFKGKKYEISVLVEKDERCVAFLHPKMFPTFDTVMFAYIFCVGLIRTAYRDEEIMFTAMDKETFDEIRELQED